MGRSSLPDALPASFYDRPTEIVARDLLGCTITTAFEGQRCVAEIVETEAYVGPHDPASHAAERIGRTRRNDPMFGPPGTAYVYLIYGMHVCVNFVTCRTGIPAAVLIRAARPLEGIEAIRERRLGRPDRDLLRGPGNLCRGLGITLEMNGHPLDRPPLLVGPGSVPDSKVAVGPRIGITQAADWPLRFWLRKSPWVSR